MTKQRTDKDIVRTLARKLGDGLSEIEYDSQERLIKLSIKNCNLPSLPSEVFRLTELQSLDISGNNLSLLPEGIAKLLKLNSLNISRNSISSISKKIGRLSNLLLLNLSNNDLTAIPVELCQLPRLQSLILSRNSLTSLPNEIGQLNQLAELYIDNNYLETLPNNIGQITQLRYLDLSDNKLLEVPMAIGKLNELLTLSIRSNQLGNISDTLVDLSSLEILDLSRNQISFLPDAIGNLIQLQSLNLTNNRLSVIPDSIGNLIKLPSLDLSRNRLTVLPDSIGHLFELQSLNLNSNELAVIPDRLGQLKQLEWLDLGDNLLSAIPQSIDQLANLQFLNLSGNQLATLPSTIGYLFQLETLDLSDNRLIEIPDSLGQLSKLQILALTWNQLALIPDSLGQLSQLQALTLSGNKLTIVPDSLGQLAHLLTLQLSGNQLTAVPDSLGHLPRLQTLALGGNLLISVPDSFGQLTQLQWLDLGGNQLISIPETIGQLNHLQILAINGNRLKELPETLGQLAQLRSLDLSRNQISTILKTLSKLSLLEKLYIYGNQLTIIESTIGQLTQLHSLDISRNQLTEIPETLGQLSLLEELYVHDNLLTVIPESLGRLSQLESLDLSRNQLTIVPESLGRLSQLESLDLSRNQLTAVPDSLGRLSQLESLDLSRNQLNAIPNSISDLIQLRSLDLSWNQITTLPENLDNFVRLQTLFVNNNQLTTVPDSLGQLSLLQSLDLSQNQMTHLPANFGRLSQLEELYLNNNQLTNIPMNLGQLSQLQSLTLNDNPNLMTPPPEIVAQGTEAIVAFMLELERDHIMRYEAKLLLVGEGGTGKSSMLRALRGENFVKDLATTHGVEVNIYQHPHPDNASITLKLNTWDFGGQEIYHATHQFFLTQRSLYVVVWNTRLGAEQGRLDYWLKTIQALAPRAVVFLVATHVDEYAADLNYQLYKATYPQIKGSFEVSNQTGQGIDTFKTALAEQAAQLPLMGQPWPSSWLAVEQSLSSEPAYHIDEASFYQICKEAGAMAPNTLGDYLHELGKVLYFRDDNLLRNLVVLKPNWITKAISHVLTDEKTRKASGIFSESDLSRIWSRDEQGQAYDKRLYPAFLRLMERFDLSYQIRTEDMASDQDSYLVPQLLPFQPPTQLPQWPETPPVGQTQVQMIYHLDFVPAGILSWFIVRTHRYTTSIHWREGVVLAYEGHEARVELNPIRSELRIVAWGVQPQNFFSILMNTTDLILARFNGLRVEKVVPCICHWERHDLQPCPRTHRYDDLVLRLSMGRIMIECPKFGVNVSVMTLLYGIHPITDHKIIEDIRNGVNHLLRDVRNIGQENKLIQERLKQQSELIAHNFERHWNLEMHKLNIECPNTFCLMPGKRSGWNPQNWTGIEFQMYLLCQFPSSPHMLPQGYSLRQPKEWWIQINPWLKQLIRFLKYGVPLGTAVGAVYDEATAKQFEEEIKLLEQMSESLPTIDTNENVQVHTNMLGQTQEAEGAALRALHSVLKVLDPSEYWAGLQRTPTKEGNILWLCAEHHKLYQS